MIFSITTDLFPKKCLRSICFNFWYCVECQARLKCFSSLGYICCNLVFNKMLVQIQNFKKKIPGNCWLVLSDSSNVDNVTRRSVNKNFAKFTGKHLCQSLFCNNDAGKPSSFFIHRTPPRLLNNFQEMQRQLEF